MKKITLPRISSEVLSLRDYLVIRKEIHCQDSLIVVEKKKSANGEMRQTNFKDLKKREEVATIGDYLFQNSEAYPKNLQG